MKTEVLRSPCHGWGKQDLERQDNTLQVPEHGKVILPTPLFPPPPTVELLCMAQVPGSSSSSATYQLWDLKAGLTLGMHNSFLLL